MPISRPVLEVADIVRAQGNRFLERCQSSVSYQQLKALRAIRSCRTATLGGHIDVCHGCGYQAGISYNSCRSRHCPKCQAQAREHWIEAWQRELLPVGYFHVVFTVPHELIPLALTSAARFYDLLFLASSQTLLEVAADPKRLGADIGFLAILHSWSQKLLSHPHVHWSCARLSERSSATGWSASTGRVLELSGPAAPLQHREQFTALMDQLRHKKWIVYTKPPFGGPAHVPRYLGRYTHRIAISNHRILGFDGEHVTFRWRDSAHGNKQRAMTLDATEFLRHFFLHVLPKGFVRIRHYGLLSNRFRQKSLKLARKQLASEQRDTTPAPNTSAGSASLWHCPRCGSPMCVVRRLTAAELFLSTDPDSS